MSAPTVVLESESDYTASGNKLFPEKIEVRGPRGFRAALRTVAKRRHTHSSEVIRQIVIASLAGGRRDAMSTAPGTIESRARALADTTSIDIVKNGHDKLSALRIYAEKTKDREKLGEAIEWLMRHEIRAGEILGDLKAQCILDQGKGGDRKSRSRPDTVKLADLGIAESQSSRWQELARLSAEEQTSEIGQAKEKAFAAIAKSVGKKRSEASRRNPLLDKRWEEATPDERKLFVKIVTPAATVEAFGMPQFYRAMSEEQKQAIDDELTAMWEAREAENRAKARRNALIKDINRDITA